MDDIGKIEHILSASPLAVSALYNRFVARQG